MKHIVCSTDNNYAPYCAIMLQSLVSTNQELEFCVHILSNDIDKEYKNSIKDLLVAKGSNCIFHNVDESKLKDVKFRMKNPLTKSAYYRILLSSILTSVDIVLYLDVDIIVNGDLSPLFNIDMNDYGVAACRDSFRSPICDEHRMQLNFSYSDLYFNSGVMLINLEYWRKNGVEDKLLEFAKRERFVYFHDQDALNYVFKNKWFQLSPKYNYLNVTLYDKRLFNNPNDEDEYIHHPLIIHFASNLFKPWNNVMFVPYKSIFRHYSRELNIGNQKKILPLLETTKSYVILIGTKIANTIYGMPPFIALLIFGLISVPLYIIHLLSFGRIPPTLSLFSIRNL